MRVVVIGGTGRVGSYLVPRLVEAGHEVRVVCRGGQQPRREDPAWALVSMDTIDRNESEARGAFGRRIASLEPDAVIDMICFEPGSARQLVEALRPRGAHLIVCGTAWVYGHSVLVPTDEAFPRRPVCEYGRKKAAVEALLLEAGRAGFPATTLHAGHIVGPTDRPVNPVGNKDPRVFGTLARGEKLRMPNLGMETLHHVHADDLAQGFVRAVERREAAAGESFHVLAPQAVTMRGYAEEVASWFGHQANLEYVPWPAWSEGVEAKWAQQTWDHLRHSPHGSIAKARERLGYAPRYSSFAAVREALAWLINDGQIEGVTPDDWGSD